GPGAGVLRLLPRHQRALRRSAGWTTMTRAPSRRDRRATHPKPEHFGPLRNLELTWWRCAEKDAVVQRTVAGEAVRKAHVWRWKSDDAFGTGRTGTIVYDPCCGSGGSLNKCRLRLPWRTGCVCRGRGLPWRPE